MSADHWSPTGRGMVVDRHFQHSSPTLEIVILGGHRESNVLYLLAAVKIQKCATLQAVLESRKIVHEGAILAALEEVEVELLPWRRFLERLVNTRQFSNLHMLMNIAY